jgi:hypothetical protein
MQQSYKGSYFKGHNIGAKQFRQRAGKTLSHITNTITPKSNSKTFWIVFGTISLCILIGFFYFNRKESLKHKRDNIADSIELIQGVAQYNLETDLAKSQSTNSAKHASINYRNPAKVKEILLEKQKAIALENKRRNDYKAKQYALDYTQNDVNLNVNNEMRKQSHDQFHQPPQPIDATQYSTIVPIDKSRQEQTDMMYKAQFNNNTFMNNNKHMKQLNDMYQEKPHFKINSPFIHPEETTRPFQPEPQAFNNTVEVGNKPDMFMQNVPSNIFENGFFQVEDKYESPFLSNASGVSKYGNPIRSHNQPVDTCLSKSNINQSGDSNVSGYTHPDYYFSGFQ